MSKIEVNTVEPQCGTTLTLGGSGDTVALGSGAAQTGFGRTGTVDWVTTPKVTGDSPITAVTGKGYFLNTTAGVITINLPAGAAGSIVSMADYAATWQTNKVTVAANGSEKIGGDTNNAFLESEGQSVTFVYVDSTQGWVNTMDSTSNVRGVPPFMAATVSGACNTLVTAPDCANAKIATFKGPGTFCVSRAAVCATNNLVSYMIVAGGGGGGTGSGGGGGGAGGFRETKSPATPYTASPLDGYATPGNRITVTATGYPIVVGGGGGVTPWSPPFVIGASGNNSSFGGITGTGGGGGGTETVSPAAGATGGSGGGNNYSAPCASGGAGNTPPTTPSQGNPGGGGVARGPYPGNAGGGGGGAGGTGIGAPPGSEIGGAGGLGITTSIDATPTARAGGGGAGGQNGPGGVGDAGGGTGARTYAPAPVASTAATIYTGSGGGGGGAFPAPAGGADGQSGGSGIVIIRYKFQ